MREPRRGVSLVETLLVLAILILFPALLFAVGAPAREAGRRRVCVANLRQIGQALWMYRQDYDGREPDPGVRAAYSQLGLPSLPMVSHFAQYYVKSRSLLVCPSYHGRIPVNQLLSTYAWVPGDDSGRTRSPSFSHAVARRGNDTPVMTDEQHNPPLDEAKEPRWARRRVIVLRLDGRVNVRSVPLRQSEIDW
jgi:hypothetical protein